MQGFGATIFGGSFGKHSESLPHWSDWYHQHFPRVVILRSQRSFQASPGSDILLIDTCCAWVFFSTLQSLCNKDIQVMYTVFIWAGIYRIKLFWQLSTDFRFPVCLTRTEKWLRLTLRSPIASLIFSLQLGHLFFHWWYFLLADVSGWRMKQPTSDWQHWNRASTCLQWKFLLRLAARRWRTVRERRLIQKKNLRRIS